MEGTDRICIIFGGSGFIGTHLSQFFLANKGFDKVVIADIKEMPKESSERLRFVNLDVRNNIRLDIKPQWIFNLAAIHREPGHTSNEYFETNIKGARNVCEFAEKKGCQNIYFTSSISIYGPTNSPTDENKEPCPISPYGGSKYPAELIHQLWQLKDPKRRLIIVRPGVIYGPGDPGNILRMIKAVKRRYFFYPGNKQVRKSYGYIYGLLDSIHFTMNSDEKLIIYNYVEHPTEKISELVSIIKKVVDTRIPVISLPKGLLLLIAKVLNFFLGNSNPIHPVRVKKASTPTEIVPEYLLRNGFQFKYNFESSLVHWKEAKPDDF
jgi:nucleoside-diphosphate-sugar epimerase